MHVEESTFIFENWKAHSIIQAHISITLVSRGQFNLYEKYSIMMFPIYKLLLKVHRNGYINEFAIYELKVQSLMLFTNH
jgi:hypothetical protein